MGRKPLWRPEPEGGTGWPASEAETHRQISFVKFQERPFPRPLPVPLVSAVQPLKQISVVSYCEPSETEAQEWKCSDLNAWGFMPAPSEALKILTL